MTSVLLIMQLEASRKILQFDLHTILIIMIIILVYRPTQFSIATERKRIILVIVFYILGLTSTSNVYDVPKIIRNAAMTSSVFIPVCVNSNVLYFLKRISLRREKGNYILVNVSVGSRIQAIASMMACMMFKDMATIKPYYVVHEKYTILLEEKRIRSSSY